MVNLPPQVQSGLVPKLIGASPVPSIFVEELDGRFHAKDADGNSLSTGEAYFWNLHAYLGHLVGNVIPVVRLALLVLLKVDQNGEVHLLHWIFSVPVSAYRLHCAAGVIHLTPWGNRG